MACGFGLPRFWLEQGCPSWIGSFHACRLLRTTKLSGALVGEGCEFFRGPATRVLRSPFVRRRAVKLCQSLCAQDLGREPQATQMIDKRCRSMRAVNLFWLNYFDAPE